MLKRIDNQFTELTAFLKTQMAEELVSQIISNLKNIISTGISDSDIEKIIQNLLNNPKFRENFLRNPQIAVISLGI